MRQASTVSLADSSELVGPRRAHGPSALRHRDCRIHRCAPDARRFQIDAPVIIHRQYTRQWPHQELERTWMHRERLGELTAALTTTHLFHGHFHTPSTKRQRASFGEVRATGLTDNFYVDANLRFSRLQSSPSRSLQSAWITTAENQLAGSKIQRRERTELQRRG
jgi:hypothetical protein